MHLTIEVNCHINQNTGGCYGGWTIRDEHGRRVNSYLSSFQSWDVGRACIGSVLGLPQEVDSLVIGEEIRERLDKERHRYLSKYRALPNRRMKDQLRR